MTKIEWCDITINPVVGCSKCSPGCDNCYAERFAARLAKNPATAQKYAGVVDEHGKWTGEVSPLHDLSCFHGLPKTPKRIFVGSMTDMFHPNLHDNDGQGWRAMLSIFRTHPRHTFITLTKRPDRMERDLDWLIAQDGDLPDNYWPGVTVWDQPSADKFIPILLRIPAAKRIVSIEPMLGPVDLKGKLIHWTRPDGTGSWFSPVPGKEPRRLLDWVICGGETGPKARPMHPDWARSLRDQCQAAGVPFFFKGWGEWSNLPLTPYRIGSFDSDGIFWDDVALPGLGQGGDREMYKIGKRRAGRLLDGREWNEVPQ